jgi:hypothetical protein
MVRLRNFWALAALTAGALGITLSLLLGGALGTAAATGAASPSAASTGGASAATIFGCRASVARVELANQVIAEPAIANDSTTSSTSCNTDTKAVAQVGLAGSTSPLNLGTVGPAGAYTFETGSLGGAVSPGVTSIADVQALSLSLAGYTITAAGPLEAQAAVECAGTTLTTQGSSDLNAITITSPTGSTQTIEIGGALNEVLGNLGALSALVSITANEQTSTAGVLTERLLDIKVLTSGAQIVVGEATVDYPNSSICAQNVPPTGTTTTVPGTVTTVPGTTTTETGTDGTVTTVTTPPTTVTSPSGTGGTTTVVEPSGSVPGYLQQCATGSVLDPTTGDCVIDEANGQTIFVSKPFKGPVGGTVISLAEAQSLYKSPCLSGTGSPYVFIVSASYEKAYGTPQSDRILVLGSHDRTAGLAGDDCIDAQGTTNKVTDGNGIDRIYVTKGVNRVIGGNGSNHIYGGDGKDWITDGTGDDTIYSGKLGSRIDAFGNKKHIFGGPGKDRIWTNSVVAQIHCGSDKKTLVFARRNPAKYAAKHGCKRIVLLH